MKLKLVISQNMVQYTKNYLMKLTLHTLLFWSLKLYVKVRNKIYLAFTFAVRLLKN